MLAFQRPKWAGLGDDLLRQLFECLPASSRHDLRKLPPVHLVCKQWRISARERCRVNFASLRSSKGNLAEQSAYSAGSSVKEVEISREVTDAQLQVVLTRFSGLHSLSLNGCWDSISAEGLASLLRFPNIRKLEVTPQDLLSLEAVRTLDHLENLGLCYEDIMLDTAVPDLPCDLFSMLTSLTVETEWTEPANTFQYLTKLQGLKHLTLSTGAPTDFRFHALSQLTSLNMYNFSTENVEAMLGLATLEQLQLMGHPTDEDIHTIARLTSLAVLKVETTEHDDISCHLSSVVKLCSLPKFKSLSCDLIIDDVIYHAAGIEDEPYSLSPRMVCSVPDSELMLGLW